MLIRQRMARIHELEMLRQAALQKSESITRDEEARLLQLRLLTMRDENVDLRGQLAQKDSRISSLSRQTEQIQLDLDDSQELTRTLEARLKKQDMDISSMKVGVYAMEVANMHINTRLGRNKLPQRVHGGFRQRY